MCAVGCRWCGRGSHQRQPDWAVPDSNFPTQKGTLLQNILRRIHRYPWLSGHCLMSQSDTSDASASFGQSLFDRMMIWTVHMHENVAVTIVISPSIVCWPLHHPSAPHAHHLRPLASPSTSQSCTELRSPAPSETLGLCSGDFHQRCQSSPGSSDDVGVARSGLHLVDQLSVSFPVSYRFAK